MSVFATLFSLSQVAKSTSNPISLASGRLGQMTPDVFQGSNAVKLFLLFTALSFAASVVISLTSFTRIVIVLSFLKQALGTPQLPPSQVLIGISLFLTAFIMAPTGKRLYEESFEPLMRDEITIQQSLKRAEGPMRSFLIQNTRKDDIRLFFEVSRTPRPSRADEIPMTLLIPAFMVSELTTAFRMGLYVFVPMLIVDILMATVLMSLGMMMVPPQMISLPLKVGVFLLAGGWQLVVSSLVRSFS